MSIRLPVILRPQDEVKIFRNAKILLFFLAGTGALCPLWTLAAQNAMPDPKPGPAEPVSALSTVSPVPDTAADRYLIGPNDVLDISVYDVPELSHAYTVGPAGTVAIPLLSTPVPAAGLTPHQLAHNLENAFRQSGRLRRPEVTVTVKQSASGSVAVDGAVRNPQVLPLIWRTNLVDVLVQCGGPTDDAGANVTITRGAPALQNLAREGGASAPTLTLELNKVLNGSDPAATTPVWPGDRISVARASVFYVLGDVRNPGSYSFRNAHGDLTVLRALAMAGDIAPTAKKKKAVIIRNDPQKPGGRTEIALNLQHILAGRARDPVLQANDIIYVPSSAGKRALHTLTGVPAAAMGGAGATAIVVH